MVGLIFVIVVVIVIIIIIVIVITIINIATLPTSTSLSQPVATLQGGQRHCSPQDEQPASEM